MIEVLGYKSESTGFDSRPHSFSEVDSDSDRNENQKNIHRVEVGRYVGPKTLPPNLSRPYRV